MADDSDGEYVENYSDDDAGGPQVVSSYGTRSGDRTAAAAAAAAMMAGGGKKARDGGKKRKSKRARAAWEEGKFTWDVPEDEEGNVSLAALLEAEKRRRLLRDTTPLQRGIIRHLVLVLDFSVAMADKDLLPSRHRLMMNYAVEFVREFFEQNPISQMAVVEMGPVAKRLCEMTGNPAVLVDKLRERLDGPEPDNTPSLQNALEMCRGELFHAPSHGTREVLVIYGALLSSDPGDIHDTINNLIADRIRVSMVGLAAQVAICAELCSRTNGGNDGCYSVAKDEDHFRELFLALTTPPATLQAEKSSASLLMMGFPSRTKTEPFVDPVKPSDPTELNNKTKKNKKKPARDAQKDAISFCACHQRVCREGYTCTRCATRVCRLPAECPSCGLTLILSTHLARSYHHLFPLRNWVIVPWSEAAKSTACYACLTPLPPVKTANAQQQEKAATANAEQAKELARISESGRYACQVCGNHFCIDCDVFAHEVIHNCPGCNSDTRPAATQGTNGVTHANGDMIID